MRIIDQDGNPVENLDLNAGYLAADKLLVAHHAAEDAVPGTAEEGHYEVVAEYPNGGKDVVWVVDVPCVPAIPVKEAWDEYEDVQRYILYTDEELAALEAERNVPSEEETLLDLMADHEYRLCMLELENGGNE